MRFYEFYPKSLKESSVIVTSPNFEQEVNEDIPKWAKKGALALGAAGTIAGSSMLSQKPPETTAPISAPAPVAKPISRDIKVLAQTMWAEARSHGVEGMLAVGNVINNRANETEHSRLFGQGIAGVALKPKQFSCWNAGDPNLDRVKDMQQFDEIIKNQKSIDGKTFEEWFEEFKNSGDYIDYRLWTQAIQLAQDIISGAAPDNTGGATFYHTTEVNPSWASRLVKIKKIGNHIFYRLQD